MTGTDFLIDYGAKRLLMGTAVEPVRAAIPGRRPDKTYNLAAAAAAEMMKSFVLAK